MAKRLVIKDKYKGILFIIMAGFFFSLMTFFVRLSGDLPTMQKAFFRNAVAAVVAIAMLMRTEEKFKIKKSSWPGIAARSICGTTGLICNFYAIDKLNIADANILNKLSPFFAIIASYFVLKEKANKIEWASVALAFTGALFVVKPSFHMDFLYAMVGVAVLSAQVQPTAESNFLYAMVGVAGGLGAGIAYTYVRKLGKQGERGPVIVMCFSVFSCLVTLPFIILDHAPMTWQQIVCLLCAGLAAAGGQFSITAAYQKAPAREISVFDYSQVIFAAILGFVFLDQIPDMLSIIGYVIIIGSAVFKWWYTMRQDRT